MKTTTKMGFRNGTMKLRHALKAEVMRTDRMKFDAPERLAAQAAWQQYYREHCIEKDYAVRA